MKISSIDKKPRKTGVYQLFVDGVLHGEIDEETVFLEGLAVGVDLDEGRLLKILLSGQMRLAKEMAFSRLAVGNYTQQQLSRKLKEKKFCQEAIDFALDKVSEYGLLDDEKYARMYIEEYSSTKGKLRLRMELRERGVSTKIIDDALQDCDPDLTRVIKFSQNFAEKNPISDRKNKDKLIRSLQYKGFDWEIIGECLRRIGDDLSDI